MSLWSAESPVLAIAPGSAALLRRRGGGKEIVVSEQRDPTRLLPQLETLFGKAEWKTDRVDVVFSHKLVRHVLTAPPGKALKSIEETALARAALIDVFGEEASAWRVRTLSQPPQYGILGAGVDEALCGGLENLGQRHGWTARLRPLAAALPEARGAA